MARVQTLERPLGPQLTGYALARATAWIDTGEAGVCGQKLTNGSGDRCKAWAGAGTDHAGYGACVAHAGKTKMGKVIAARERAYVLLHEMRQASRFYGQHVEISPEQALQEEVGRSVGIVRWLESKLSRWGYEAEPIADRDTGLPVLVDVYRGIRATTIADSEYAAWLKTYQVERAMLARAAKMCIDAGVSQKMVAIWAYQADTMHKILVLACERMGMDSERVAVLMPEVIAEVTGAPRLTDGRPQ